MKRLLSLALLASTPLLVSPAFGASQDECAIWICAPGGFPSGCGDAHDAMVDRVKDGKSPLPSFSSCSVTPEGGSSMSSNHGVAAYIPPQRVCTRWRQQGHGERCVSYETQPERYVRGTSCRKPPNDDLNPEPAGCTRTVRYVEVFADGELVGPAYYW